MSAAGTIITGLDTPDTVSDVETAAITGITSTTFTASGGNVCGVTFVANTWGKATIDYASLFGQSTTAAVEVAPAVREGAVIGSGATVIAAASENAVRWLGVNSTAGDRQGASLFVSGLTPGDTYNVQLEHRVSGSTGRVESRRVTVSPAT